MVAKLPVLVSPNARAGRGALDVRVVLGAVDSGGVFMVVFSFEAKRMSGGAG